jgi:hypothetical protein
MSKQLSLHIQKAHIEITVEGCIECGTRWSRGWHPAKSVSVLIQKKERMLVLHRCADCETKQSSNLAIKAN